MFLRNHQKKSRGQKILKSPVHLEAEKLNIPIRHPNNLNNETEIQFIKKVKAHFVVVVAYGQMIPDKLLNEKNLIPEYPCIVTSEMEGSCPHSKVNNGEG